MGDSKLNGSPTPTPTSPKPKLRRKLRRFHVLEYVDTIDAHDEAEVRARLPKTRAFEVREVDG